MKSNTIMKTISHLRGFLAAFLIVGLLIATAPPMRAADLKYTTLPQDTETDLVRANKVASIASGASNKFNNITTATTTTVKTGSGVLERIVVNTGGASSVWVAYDNTAGSGTKIATGSSATQIVLAYNCRFATGLTIVTSTGTPADITVVYR